MKQETWLYKFQKETILLYKIQCVCVCLQGIQWGKQIYSRDDEDAAKLVVILAAQLWACDIPVCRDGSSRSLPVVR